MEYSFFDLIKYSELLKQYFLPLGDSNISFS